jgi:hypothetical protein
MGINARKKILDNFTIEKFITEYEYAYESVLTPKVMQNKTTELFELETHQEAS